MPSLRRKQDPYLQQLDLSNDHEFREPQKKINEENDVQFFLRSEAYTDIMKFMFQLNASMFPRHAPNAGQHRNADNAQNVIVAGLVRLIADLNAIMSEAPPEPGPRRFGNVAFRTWYNLVTSRLDDLLSLALPLEIVNSTLWRDQLHSPALELKAYLLGSFGNPQRLDYGTGHELSFLAFLGCLWKLGAFQAQPDMATERRIVHEIIAPYLELVRNLIRTYNLEPAGSHGVWGLDDHSFLPYILGSAQLAPAIFSPANLPGEGSAPEAPDPGDVVKAEVVEEWRRKNLYFAAIGFIYDVKKGPFWEHSPMLYDISGVKAGWAKINKGMIKMYMAEVLSKFPVVQHFPFGSMFAWELDANSQSVGATLSKDGSTRDNAPSQPVQASTMTAAPWASNSSLASTYGARPPTLTSTTTAIPSSQMRPPKTGDSTSATFSRPAAGANALPRR